MLLNLVKEPTATKAGFHNKAVTVIYLPIPLLNEIIPYYSNSVVFMLKTYVKQFSFRKLLKENSSQILTQWIYRC